MRRLNTILVSALLLTGVISTASAGIDMRTRATFEANRLFLTSRAACGEDYVLAIDVMPAPPSGFAPVLGEAATPVTGHTLYLVMSGVNLMASEVSNTATQWQGRIRFTAARARIISVGRDGRRGAWTPIAGGEVYAADLTYRQGWSSSVRELALLANLGRFARARRPTCTEVPTG